MSDHPEAPPASDEGATIQGTDGRAVELNAAAVKLSKGDPQSNGVLESMAKPLGNDDKKRPTKPTITKDSRGLEKALDTLSYQYRYCTRAARFEIRDLESDAWTSVPDRAESDLREQIAERFCFPAGSTGKARLPARFGRDAWSDAVDALCHRCEIDSFIDWLEKLPDWNGIPALSGIPGSAEHDKPWLAQLFIVPDDDMVLARWASIAILLGAVWRAYEPGTKIDEMVVMVGPQAAGKSTAIEWLLPESGRERWFNSGLYLAGDDKQRVEAMQGRVLVECGEMAGSTRADMESLKAFLSRRVDSVRLSYRRNPEDMARRCVIVGTSNDKSCLPNDPSGLRRFVAINTAPRLVQHEQVVSVREYLDRHREQMWAQALYIYRNRADFPDTTPYVPPALAQQQAERNEKHRRTDETLESALSEWGHFQQPGSLFSLAEVAAGLELFSSIQDAAKMDMRMQRRIGSALRIMGWEKTQTTRSGTRGSYWIRS